MNPIQAVRMLDHTPGTTGRQRPARRLAWRALLFGFLGVAAVAFAADHTMREGDTLYALAAEHYGDPSYWRALQWYNGVQNVHTIPIGTEITFPDTGQLDEVRRILDDPAIPGVEKSQQIAALGGREGATPTVNEGTGTLLNYNALSALGARRVSASSP